MIPIERMGGRLGNRMFQLAYLYSQQRRGAIPDIWLQDPKWFEGAEDVIRAQFGTGIGHRDEVAVHVRRGDYVTVEKAFTNLGETDYYERAVAMFPDGNFLVFSDDPDWCRRKWAGQSRFQIVRGLGEIEDFNLMASCQHQIIANSSFSWWAGFLNPNPNKTVVYPKSWFTVDGPKVGFPKEWIGI